MHPTLDKEVSDNLLLFMIAEDEYRYEYYLYKENFGRIESS
jgi:hypothetical protein